MTSQSVVRHRGGDLLSAGRRALLGLLLVSVGIAVLIDRTSVDGDEAVATPLWWLPLLVILAGCLRVVWFVRQPWDAIRPAVIILVGILVGALGLAAPTSPLVAGRYGPFLWPASLIVAGVWITVGRRERRLPPRPGELRESIWLRGDMLRPGSCMLSGRLRVVLGYVVLDLRGCEPASFRCALDLTVILGHVRILAPAGVTVDRRPAFVVASRGMQYQSPIAAPEEEEEESTPQPVVHVIGIFGDAVIISGPRGRRCRGGVRLR
jgi:hypothetical protein